MTLMSVDPNRLAGAEPDVKVFHQFRLLGETAIVDSVTRSRVADLIEKSVAAWDGNYMMCFDPRHAVRVCDGSSTYDLLICFECQRVQVFSRERPIGTTGLIGTPEPLDEILRAANVRLPAPAQLDKVKWEDLKTVVRTPPAPAPKDLSR